MPRIQHAILIEAELWKAVNDQTQELNELIAKAAGELAESHVASVLKAARGDLLDSVEGLTAGALKTLAVLREMQDPVLRLGEIIGDRLVTLRLEAAEATGELDS